MDEQMEIVGVWNGTRKASRVPVWLMRQAGRYLPEYRQVRAQAGSFLDLCFEAKLAAEVTLQPMRRFDLDAAIIFSDILILPHALGQGLRFAEGEGPLLEMYDNKFWQHGNGLKAEIVDPVYEAIKVVRAELAQSKALIGFAGSPWTVASYMIEGKGGHDFAGIKAVMQHKRHEFVGLMDRLVEQTIVHLKAQIAAGVNAVQLFESWAGVLTGADFADFVIAPNKRIIAGVKAAYPNVSVIFFPRTANTQDLFECGHVGADCIGLSQDITPEFAAKHLQNDVCLQGNLSPNLLLKGGADMKAGVEHICQNLAGGRFVFNLGHGVIKETPPEHVEALVNQVHEWVL